MVETERECRICRGEDEPGRPLLHPCRCSGSIKYTHEDCLVNWLSQSGSSRCELCNHPFRFEPLYQPNTPSALPTREFLIGVLALTTKTLKTAARIVLVFTVWLFFLPVGTCWTWYALFINSPYQLPSLLASRGPAGVFADAFYGCLLSAGIVFIFLGVSSLREYIRHFPQDELADNDHALDLFVNEEDLPVEEFDDDGSSDEDEDHHLHRDPFVDREQHLDTGLPFIEDVIPNPLDNNNGDTTDPAHVPDSTAGEELHDEDISDEVFDEVDELVRDTYDVIAGGDESDDEIGVEADILAEDSEEDEEQVFENYAGNRNQNHIMDFNAHELVDDSYDGSSETIEGDNRFDQDVDMVPAEVDNFARDEHLDDDDADDNDGGGEGGALFGLFELDPDEVPLEEVVGLRGHIRNLFDNAGTVLVSNAIFLGVFTLIPLLIGRLTLRLFHLRGFPTRMNFVYKDDAIRSLLNIVWPSIVKGQERISVETNELSNAILNSSVVTEAVKQTSGAAVGLTSPHASARHHVVADITGMHTFGTSTDPLVVSYDNLLIVLLGYGVIALVAVAYIGLISMLRQRYPRLDSPITRQVARLLRYVATFIKIVVLILFEFGVFPLGCGWWLDICTLEILGGSLQSRLAFCHDSPWTCTGGHWVMGIIYMVHISLFISLLREIVKPELLWFLRNPDDPEFHPFRELVEKPLSRHARRMCISVIIYVPLILALVYAPAQLCLKFLPHVFPFRSEDFSHILIDVPFGNLLIGPLIRLLYFGRPGISLQKVVGTWIKWVSNALGIAHLVVKDSDSNENNRVRHLNQNNEVRRDIEGLHPGDRGPLHRIFGDHDEDIVNGIPIRDQGNPEPISEAENATDDSDYPTLTRSEVRARAAIMILSAWITLIFAESALIAVPTILGRSMMGWFGLPVRHDLHPFLLGLNVLLGTLSGVARLIKYAGTVDTMTAVSLGLPYLYMVGKGFVIIVVWLGMIPLAAGLLFELVLVPLRVSYNETPYFCLHQDWALGLLLLKVWTCIAVTGGLGNKWRERVLRARQGDIIGVNENFPRTMREVVLPVLFSVVTALSLPYSFARGILPLLGAGRWFSNLVYRYAYLVVTCLCCCYESVRYSVSILRDLHDSIRDEKYLMGKKLYNFIESPDAQATNE